MNTPIPLARSQQITGMPEHPCETIVRNGAIICPYEEMEVQFFEEHAGLYLITLIGKPFEIFGWGGHRAKASLHNGYLPVIKHETTQKGCRFEQTVFACLLDGDKVVTGEEPLINMINLEVTNLSDIEISIPITIVLGSCFRKTSEEDSELDKYYWKEFLLRNDISEDISTERQLEPYPFELRQEGNFVVAKDKGIVFHADYGTASEGKFVKSWSEGTWKEGKKIENGWSITLGLKPYESKTIRYKVPYLPLTFNENNCEKLENVSYDKKIIEYTNAWNFVLNKSGIIDVPGTQIKNLWKAQTAATLILVDRQNKGSEKLFGREIYSKWAGKYPDKVLCYVHLSPTLYEFIWAQEAAYWVMGMLDMQGYHSEVEEYFETFFELQGKGIPGIFEKNILPSNFKSYMGTTPHTWLNSNGGVLLAIAEHYKLTRNRGWIIEHKESILSACRWICELRNTTKTGQYVNGYGIMPPGQSTDLTFASDHLQWYYTDIWTIRGLDEISKVLKECGIEEAEQLVIEVQDYKLCFLKSLDSSIVSIEEFKDKEFDYDFTCYKFSGPLQCDAITEWDENGIPLKLKGKVLLKHDAEQRGIRLYVPMSPQANIPFTEPYLDGVCVYALAFLSGIIDYSSDKSIYPGSKYSGKDIWEGIISYCKEIEVMDIHNGIFLSGLPYNDFIIKKLLQDDETILFNEVVNFALKYGCDRDTYMGKETAGIYLKEMWFQPSPFSLSMATMRKWLRNALIYEDEKENRLVIGKAIPKEWFESAVSSEEPISIEKIASYYGPISASYHIDFTCLKVKVNIQMHDMDRYPMEVEVRIPNLRNLPIKQVKLNGVLYHKIDLSKNYVYYCPAHEGMDGKVLIEIEYIVK